MPGGDVGAGKPENVNCAAYRLRRILVDKNTRDLPTVGSLGPPDQAGSYCRIVDPNVGCKIAFEPT